MYKKAKKGVGQNKNFGPIQKVTVPDFQSVSNAYEKLQSEILEKPSKARKQMKPFTIRKATNAAAVSASADASGKFDSSMRPGDQANSSMQGQTAAQLVPEPGSVLTPEDLEAIQPKAKRVVNPWIHEQTHKEFLNKITGLPARHSNVILSHKQVIKEKTFLPDPENLIDKDKATKEALAILEKEYEIFNDPNMLPVKALTRYDCWDQDRTPEQWVAYCQARPDQPHAMSPNYTEEGEYAWKPVQVVAYDAAAKRFQVRVVGTSQIKNVTRLSLLFYAEDPEMFRQRVDLCKERQRNVESELRFTNLIDAVPTDSVSILSKERRENFLTKCMRDNDKFNPDFVYNIFTKLMRVVQEEYIRQMKKCIVLKQMEDPNNYFKFQKLKIPIRINKKTSPYFGVVRCPKYNFLEYQGEILREHWCSSDDMSTIVKQFTRKCIDFQNNRFMNTSKAHLKLPRELKDLEKFEDEHLKSVVNNMVVSWRETACQQITEKLGGSDEGKHNFFYNENEQDEYLESKLRKIIIRFELIMNSYLREFARQSINDWVNFIRSFTIPKYAQDELWDLPAAPLVNIHLAVQKPKAKGKKPRRKQQVDAEGNPIPHDPKEDLEYMSQIVYSPNLEECRNFIRKALNTIVDSNNRMMTLEKDLMPFLKLDERPNFMMDMEFPWVVDAMKEVNQMLDENTVGPENQLKEYKKYEYILNVDSKQLIVDLFQNKERAANEEVEGELKAHIDEIRENIEQFHVAEDEILNVSNNTVDSTMFRIEAAKLKGELAHVASKIKNKLFKEVEKWCADSVKYIWTTYNEMEKRIMTIPQNEKELKETREFIKVSKEVTQVNLMDLLKEVDRHYELLDDYSYIYKEEDLEFYYEQKKWPMKIGQVISDGQADVIAQEELLGQKLEQDKDDFAKQLLEFQARFEQVITLKNLDNVSSDYIFANKLHIDIENAHDRVQQFNDREQLFGQTPSVWPSLDELTVSFKPFYELLENAYNVINNLRDWTSNPLLSLNDNYESMDALINQWQQSCFMLSKKLVEDFEDAADVANEIRKKLDDFKDYLPIIRCITSEAIEMEDWNEIREVAGQPDMEQDAVAVDKFVELNLMKFAEDIDEIASRAERKFALKKKLKELKEKMKTVELDQMRYKGITFVIKGYDEITAVVDEQTVATQAMLGSSNMRGQVKKDTLIWEAKLKLMQEVLDEIKKCQSQWMYLEPIFASDDIGKTMPNEAVWFKDVDTLWKTQMDAIDADKGILDLVDRDAIQSQFQEANKKLDKIQKSLDDYLEEKRQIFARFYFLASKDLLMLLAQTKDPRAVQPHMDKCFEGIQSVKFDPEEGDPTGKGKAHVTAMLSAEGEVVEFNKVIDVNEGEKKGNVERWMIEIEAVMRGTLKQKTKDSLQHYMDAGRVTWVSSWPGMIILAVDQIHWTSGVEDALRKGDKALADYEALCDSQIQEIVEMVRGDLSDQLRTTLKALTVIDVHARDVVTELKDKHIQDPYSFDWTAQLRYYWEEKDILRVKMVTASIDYGYEYLGNSLRLVITPLTDRCYRTLMGAKQLNYGGAPEGPAGTGKTESVKDLAKALAVQCVVFNCSDGLDYKAMGKFFKGLASSGAWCCFDEFNRIDLEVLSVIAQQILTIQNAIISKVKVFKFEDTERLALNPACAVNITMNPGYAGRSELPDNLKALFRPCAMMVPNYALIAQIELYSFGYARADYLSVKVVASLSLSSEQLSSQFHYDFGMRAVKAILTACGNLKRQLKDWPEDQICLRALKDVNLPKFTSNDIPLYKGITSDLFPNVELPVPDYEILINAMKEQCRKQNLQPKDEFINKCIQLYETIMVRHGLMVVGGAFSGKSKIINVLKDSFGYIKNNPKFVPVLTSFINPKSILQTQLYGMSDMDTGEWTDGVLAIKVSDAAASQTSERKWIIFDGPVDAVWIENMNTVLDDNKKLCLNSGSIIKLKPTMTIMFEVEDLSQASPATVSRCGMVLTESKGLGFNVLVTSYVDSLRELLDEKICRRLHDNFQYIADVAMEFTRVNCKFPVNTGPNFYVANMLGTFDCFVRGWFDEDAKLPKDCGEIVDNAVVFAAIWGVGGQIDENGRVKYNAFLQDLIMGEDVITKYKVDIPMMEPRKIPNKISNEVTDLFEICFQAENCSWTTWMKTIPAYVVPKGVTFAEVIVPTLDSVRADFLLNTLLNNGKHCLFVGPTGTGKSIVVSNALKENFENEHNMYLNVTFSAQTSANKTQEIIDGVMEKKRKGVYGPGYNKRGIIFVDDLNMPKKEKYGAQPPIELLRQWMDYEGWYEIETKEKEFRKIVKVQFCAAMGPPGSGRAPISDRYTRHYNVLYIAPYSDASLNYIFSNVMDYIFGNQGKLEFSAGVKGLKASMVQATIQTYQEVGLKFKPTPAKSHYTFNLRDVSKVFQGINKTNPRAISKDDDLIKCWAHECCRVFQDRLLSIEDRNKFDELIQGKTKEKFKKEWDKLVTVKPLLFASFCPLIYPDGDESKKPYQNIYCQLTDKDLVKKKAEDSLLEFNQMHRQKKMDLVLFTDAIEHVVKIHRVITTQFGHCLLVGVGGSGRKSVSELATFMAGFEIMSLEMVKGYDFNMWRDDMKQKLFINCGVDAQEIVFLFSDTQITNEAFVEDINNILNNGEIPNLYNLEDLNGIQEAIKEANKSNPTMKALLEDNNAIFSLFTTQAKNGIHCVLTFSPVGDEFKTRLRMFPSLVNCCTIDWFLPWPTDALTSVAQYFLKKVDDLPQVDGLVTICVDMQTRVRDLALKYVQEHKKYYYVTPTSYLILIKSFTQFLATKRKQIDTLIRKFDRGLSQLQKAQESVAELQKELIEVIGPNLKVSMEETAVMSKEIEKKKVVVDAERKIVAEEAAVATGLKNEADTIEADCKGELKKVMPIYESAMAAVKALQSGDVTELKSFQTAKGSVALVAKALCLYFNTKPAKTPGAKPGEVIWDYWTPCKKNVLNAQLLNNLKGYDKDNIDPKLVEDMRPILAEEGFADAALKNASKAAFGIGKWCRAIIEYDDAMKIVRPKQAELKEAQASSAAAKKKLDDAQARLDAKEAEMKQLADTFMALQKKEQELKDQKDDCERRRDLANALITSLASERENWKKELAQNRANKQNLVGDVIISSGIIAYLGVFIQEYRQECISNWAKYLMEFNIPSTDNVNLQNVLGNPVKIRKWQIDQLPQDAFSTDNAIILEYSERWGLMIDPQMQANIWLKQTHKEDKLIVIKPTMDPKKMSSQLEASISVGNPVIFEDATETFDPMLDPLLAKQIEKKGSEMSIKFGEQLINFSPDFKFYITTKMSSPHYSPEVCVKVTMLNFMVTKDGLLDQMLNMIIKIENEKKYEQRNQLIEQKAANEKKVAESQDKILDLIANSKDDILEDKELKTTLDESKIQSDMIAQQLKEGEILMAGINKLRDGFIPVATRASNLFIDVLIKLIIVDPMYQYSLEFYRGIFETTLLSINQLEEKISTPSERRKWFIEKFTYNLYKNVCRSLFEKDKLLFSFQICLSVKMEVAVTNQERFPMNEIRFMMAGATQVELTRPNPVQVEGGWLSDKMWCSFLELSSKFDTFKGFELDFEKNVATWEKIYNSPKPFGKDSPWPGKWNDIDLLAQCNILRILRPDKVVDMVRKIIKKEPELQRPYIETPPFSIEEILNDSNNKQPIIIVLSAGADPMTEIQLLAQKKMRKCESLSLGQGQGDKAVEAIKTAQKVGQWVVLQNCHLAPSFMPTLDALIEEIERDDNSAFRIWLTTMPSDRFPVTIVQNAIKATSEPPKGLKNNIIKSYQAFRDNIFEDSKKPQILRRLLWGLCFFNALILERRKFGPLGWNIRYEFSASDLRISKDQLVQFLDYYETIPFDALKYMVAEANYGGRVTDPQDRRCIMQILSDFYCPEIVETTNHKLSESGAYYTPNDGTRKDYIEFLEDPKMFPVNDLTEIFGMHMNAEITAAINDTNHLMDTALSLQPRSTGGGGKSQDEILQETATGILEKLPKNFDTEYAGKKHPIRHDQSLNTVLAQELLRFNKLLSTIRSSLIDIGRAIVGEIVMTADLEEVSNSLFDNRVPAMWMKASYPSLKPLASYVIDFVERLEFMNKWIEGEAPPSFWISGFYFTQSFLTGIKQNFARKYVLAIDTVDWDFKVLEDSVDTTKGPEDGAYIFGMFLEGCKWDSGLGMLAESDPKVLFTKMPYIHLIPKKRVEINRGHSYECPVYKTLERRGTLSTTGHSTNFVTMIWLPIQKRHEQKHWIKRGVALVTSLND